jgi:hypothetical protein
MNHDGRCRKCANSLMRQLYRGSETDKRIWQYCFHYSSWCKLVSRNCSVAFVEIKKNNLMYRNIKEKRIRDEMAGKV